MDSKTKNYYHGRKMRKHEIHKFVNQKFTPEESHVPRGHFFLETHKEAHIQQITQKIQTRTAPTKPIHGRK